MYILNTDKKTGGKTPIGTRSTKKSKAAANNITKIYLENGWLKMRSAETLKEFSQYEEVTPNVFKGPRSGHDDCVTSLLWAVYFVITPFFEGKDWSKKDIDKAFVLKREAEGDDIPVILFDNGPSEVDSYGFRWD